jgi:uncharacterized delta-60 repeat protein
VDTNFNPNANSRVSAIAVQADGKILVGGLFTSIGGQPRNHIARLNATNGLADSFDPNANVEVRTIAVQPDGKILIGGDFTRLTPNGGAQVIRNRIARLDDTGSPDSFDPNANVTVETIAVQTNGQILVGGSFNGANSIGGQARNFIARLDGVTGSADSFNPNAKGVVYAIAVQADGKIVVGGNFVGTNSIGGATRNRIARLDASGFADSFDPNANGPVRAIALMADGKILAGGSFAIPFSPTNNIGGAMRNFLARLDGATGLADSFNPNPDAQVNAIALQADGRVLVGGFFSAFAPSGGATVARGHVARFGPPELPLLNIRHSAPTNVVLSWATNFTGFTLEANTNLNTNVWSVVSPASVVSGTNNVVTNAANTPARFYRLRK